MIRQFSTLCGVLLCLCLPAHAQITPIQAEAENALVSDDPATTVALSQQMLAQNPDNYAGWFLLALGQSDLGNDAEAAQAAAQAYRRAASDSDRLQSARLVARARLRLGHYTRSEFWLRRAANHAESDEDARAIVREYLATVQANPLSVNINAGIAPSDNINNGSDDGILRFEGIDLTFRLPEDRTALSGIEYAGSVQLSYRLAQDNVQSTAVTAYLYADTFTLSQESRDLLDASPDADVRAVTGRDFASTVAQVGITHQRANLLPFGPTQLSFNVGSYWENQTRLVNYQDYIVQQLFPVSPGQSYTLRASVREQQALLDTLIDTTSYDLIGAYDTQLGNGDQLQISAAYRYNDAGFENTYDEYRAGLGYSFGQPVFSANWSASFELGYRNYDEYATTLDGRRDRFATVGLSTIFTSAQYFGFSPSVALSATRTLSNAEEVESTAVQLRVGIESNF